MWLWNAAGGLRGRLALIRQNVQVPPSAAPQPGASRRVALLPALLQTGKPPVSRQQRNALRSKTATGFPYPFPSSSVQRSSWPFTPHSWSPSPRPAPWQAPGSGHTECPQQSPRLISGVGVGVGAGSLLPGMSCPCLLWTRLRPQASSSWWFPHLLQSPSLWPSTSSASPLEGRVHPNLHPQDSAAESVSLAGLQPPRQ